MAKILKISALVALLTFSGSFAFSADPAPPSDPVPEAASAHAVEQAPAAEPTAPAVTPATATPAPAVRPSPAVRPPVAGPTPAVRPTPAVPAPAPGAVPAAKGKAAPGDKVAMNFKDTEIEAVVKYISTLTGKNYILDDAVTGKKVTVISPTEVNIAEAEEVFQAILGVKDLTIVPSGSVFKIVPTQKARSSNIETVGETSPPGDRYVTQLITLKHIPASKVSDVLNQLRSPNSTVVVYEPTNLIILTEAYSNVERLLGIIEAIDVETADVTMEIIKLQNATVESVAKLVTQAITEKGGASARRTAVAAPRAQPGQPQPASPQTTVQPSDDAAKIIPDPRTNSLIVIADAETLAFIHELVKALDVETPTGQGKINLIHLKYAEAENVASVLTAISKAAGAKPKPGQPETPQAVAATRTSTEVAAKFDEPVNVMADKATNSLVIIAAQQDFLTLKEVIEKLDTRRPQVLVEALIMEMSYKRAMELGVEWRSTANPNSGKFTYAGGTNFGGISGLASLATNPLSGPSGLFLAAIDGTVEVGGVTFPNIGALINALQTKGDVNVISTPHLLTIDNEEAEIVVSDNIPFQTSEKFDSNGNPIFTFEYRDVGLTLRFTPQINDENYVRLKLFQETSDVLSTTSGTSSNAPSTTKRSAKTSVLIKDGATVVIGGLIQDDRQVSSSSVPCLGDIPLLGALFRNNQQSKGKTNLMIFLTPHIIRESADLEKMTQQKTMEHRDYADEKTTSDKRFIGNTFDNLLKDTLAPNLAPIDKIDQQGQEGEKAGEK
ncbi:type II secretion system protein GspD [bacterium]|nr:MAG: type II secretion system protein GspD [bacterium]